MFSLAGGRVEYSYDQALETVREYACATETMTPKTRHSGAFDTEKVYRFAYRMYDCIPPSDGPDLTDLDLLVINGLNGRVDAAVFARLQSFARRACEALDQAHQLQPDFQQLGRDGLGDDPPEGTAGYSLAQAWLQGVATRKLGMARVHKVLHHKRPRLFPLLDGQTIKPIRAAADDAGCSSWQVIYDDLHTHVGGFDRLEREFGDIAVEIDGVRLSPLRLHDILVWMDVMGYRRG